MAKNGPKSAKIGGPNWPVAKNASPTRPGPNFGWPDPARTKKIALFAEKLVKNGPKYAKISGPKWPVAKKGQSEPDSGQKRPARTRPGPEKKWPDPSLAKP